MKNKSSEIEHVGIKEEPKKTTDADEDREEEDSQSPKALDFEHVEIKEELLNFEEHEEGSDDQEKEELLVEEVIASNRGGPSHVSGKHQNKRRKTILRRGDPAVVDKANQDLRRGKYEAFGRYIAKKLEDLPSEMAIFAQKFISEALFEAEMGTLSRKSQLLVPETT